MHFFNSCQISLCRDYHFPSHQQCMKVPSPYALSNFCIFANLIDEKRHLSIVSMIASLITSKVDHLFLSVSFVFLSSEL